MLYRELGQSGLTVSVVGYGGWQAGRKGWGKHSVEEFESAIMEAKAQGVNFFDTAPVYGDGASERLLGSVLAPIRDKVIIATKVGLSHSDSGAPRVCLDYDSILRECESSLQRLGTDYIDLYQIHWPDRQTSMRESFRALHRLQEEKMVRHLGVCNFTFLDLQQALRYTDQIVSVQLFYNLITRGLEQDIAPFCGKHDISILAYSPLCQGLLAGTLDATIEFGKESALKGNRHLTNYALRTRNFALLEKLKEVAARLQCSLAELALRWVIWQKGIASVMVGSASAEHIKENCLGAGRSLPDDVLGEIDSLVAEKFVQPWISFFY